MKRTLLFLALLCFTANFLLKGQERNMLKLSGTKHQPVLHKPSAFAEHEPKPSAVIPLYDSVIIWNLQAGWVPEYKTNNFAYDANTNLISETELDWSSTTWINDVLSTFTYNSGNKEISELDQTWNGSAWVNDDSTAYIYNSGNNESGKVYLTWNGSLWDNNYKDTNIYNINNLVANWIEQTWNGAAWVNSTQVLYAYNINNLDSSYLYQTCNGTAWVNSTQYTYSYNSNNSELSWTEQSWNGSAWVNDYKDTNLYNSNNLETNWVQQFWNDSVWENYTQGTYSYNSNDKITTQSTQSWFDSSWTDILVDTFTYDANNIMLSDVNFYVASGSHWDSTYYYFHKVEGINEIAKAKVILIYPNPSQGVFTIQSSVVSGQLSVEVYSMLGEKVYQTEIPDFNSTANIALDAPNGVYFIRVMSEKQGQVMNNKIVVER